MTALCGVHVGGNVANPTSSTVSTVSTVSSEDNVATATTEVGNTIVGANVGSGADTAELQPLKIRAIKPIAHKKNDLRN